MANEAAEDIHTTCIKEATPIAETICGAVIGNVAIF